MLGSAEKEKARRVVRLAFSDLSQAASIENGKKYTFFSPSIWTNRYVEKSLEKLS